MGCSIGTVKSLTSRGLTTSPIANGSRTFEIVFDFVDHRLLIETSDGATERIALAAMPVADFYAEVMARLQRLGIRVHIWAMPSEMKRPPRTEPATGS